MRERVGHSFMKATLREKHGIFGGELAGHYYFRDNFYADCALLAVIEILNLLWHDGQADVRARRAARCATPRARRSTSRSRTRRARCASCRGAIADGEIDWLDGITVQYPDWWFNVRPSNTEPLLRLVRRGPDPGRPRPPLQRAGCPDRTSRRSLKGEGTRPPLGPRAKPEGPSPLRGRGPAGPLRPADGHRIRGGHAPSPRRGTKSRGFNPSAGARSRSLRPAGSIPGDGSGGADRFARRSPASTSRCLPRGRLSGGATRSAARSPKSAAYGVRDRDPGFEHEAIPPQRHEPRL